jgi:type II secretory pathway pseudopilin PulG
MKSQPQSPGPAGFTLIEVLVSLGLCAFLATATAAAIALAARAERRATCHGEAAALIQSLYAAQRLRPDAPPLVPRGWRVESTAEIVTRPDESLREWRILEIAPDSREIPPLTLRILDDAP